MRMFTDPDHLKVSDPGKVEGNVVFAMLDAFDPDPTAVDGLKAHYRAGGLGDMGLKRRLDEIIQELLAPMRARRSAAASDEELVDHILEQGRKRAHVITMEALSDVRRAFGLEGRPGRSAALSRMQQISQERHSEGRLHEGLVDAVSSSRARFSG